MIDTVKFFKGCKEVLSLAHAHVQSTVAHDVNIHNAEGLILRNRITVHDIASNNGIIVGNVETIIHEHLLFKKVCLVSLPLKVLCSGPVSIKCCMNFLHNLKSV
jgi:hypothetical protein